MGLPKTLADFLSSLQPRGIVWVAYSGGVDSHVLLHVASSLTARFNIKAIHINHHISSHADEWAEHCKKAAKQLNIELIVRDVGIEKKAKTSLEELARIKRYDAIKKEMDVADILLTAHHEDDQAETLFLQLIRGSGVQGLSAMPSIKNTDKGLICRPFLYSGKKQILEYAHEHQLNWITDDSNMQTDFTRNYIRHEIFPLMQKRIPALTKILSRSAFLCGEVNEVLKEYVEADLKQIILANGNIKLSHLRKFSDRKQKEILRLWIKTKGYLSPNFKKLAQFKKEFLESKMDRNPILNFGNFEIRRFNDELFVFESHATEKNIDVVWPSLTESLCTKNFILAAKELKGGMKINLSNLIVKTRAGGEKIKSNHSNFHINLKKAFQEWKIPVWVREKTPLIYDQDQLICVPGYYTDKRYCVPQNEIGYEIVCKYS